MHSYPESYYKEICEYFSQYDVPTELPAHKQVDSFSKSTIIKSTTKRSIHAT